MKRLKLFAFALAVAFLAACATVGTPEQQYYTNATKATQLVDQVVLAASMAVRTNALHGEDAKTTLAAVTAARDGLKAVKTDVDKGAISFEQANSKLGITLAALTATQAYIASLKVTP